MVNFNYNDNCIDINIQNTPIKRQRLSDWLKGQDSSICIYEKCTSVKN